MIELGTKWVEKDNGSMRRSVFTVHKCVETKGDSFEYLYAFYPDKTTFMTETEIRKRFSQVTAEHNLVTNITSYTFVPVVVVHEVLI